MGSRWVKRKGPVQPRSTGKKFVLLPALLFLLFAFRMAGSEGRAEAGFGANVQVPDVCYKCHAQTKEAIADPSVHPLFKQGKCLSCHDVHASDHKGLARQSVNDLCQRCHEGIRTSLKQGRVHGALRAGSCTGCHKPHSGQQKKLLVQEQKGLCWKCHEGLQADLAKSHQHGPFKNGECSSCHEPHASPGKNLLTADPAQLCQKCHAARCSVNGVSITFVTKKMDCTGCHSGHASDQKGLFGPYGHEAFQSLQCGKCHNTITENREITLKESGKKLCFSCHERKGLRADDIHGKEGKNACTMCHNPHASRRKDMTVQASAICLSCHEKTEKETVFMERTLKSIRCTPVKERLCFECHVPLHSEQPLYLKGDVTELCSKCHQAQHKVSHPMGSNVIDPRNGQPTTCISCHSMHASKSSFMLTHDRRRQLCIQCHKG